MFSSLSNSRFHLFSLLICCLTAISALTAQPVVNPPANVTVCSGAPVVINFTGTPGATFNWTNSNTAIGLPASGSGNLNFNASNVANQEVATITVTPELAGVFGTPVIFTITVNPIPVADFIDFIWACVGEQVDISITGTPGATFNWTNDNTDIGLPASGTGDIHFVGNNVGVTQNAIVTITPTLGGCTGPQQQVYLTITDYPTMTPLPDQYLCSGGYADIKPPPTNPSGPQWQLFWTWTNNNTNIGVPASGFGKIEGDLAVVTSQEIATITYTVEHFGCVSQPSSYNLIVSPYPEVAPVDDISVCEGELVKVQFQSPTYPTYNWTNSNKLIGLPETGSGNISFNAASLDVTESGTITVTPVEFGCAGSPQTFDITVDPLSTVDQPANVSACVGDLIYIPFTGGPAGVTFSWTNSNVLVGIPSSGTGDISFAAPNVTQKQIAFMTVTPNIGNCLGVPRMFTITINPTPVVNTPNDYSVCNGGLVNVAFTGTPNTVFEWTNSNTDIGLAASGTGNINFNSPIVSSQQTATITVTPTSGDCVGVSKTFEIAVNPIPVVNDPPDISTCAGEAINVTFESSGTDPEYLWTNSNTAIGLPTQGQGDLDFTAGAFTPQTANITVRASENGCIGPPQTFTVAVSPVPVIVSPQADLVACAGEAFAINFIATPGSTVNWTNDNISIGLTDSGTGIILFTGAQVTSTQVATITYTPEIGPCIGSPYTFTITLNPIPVVADPPNISTCGGNPVIVDFSGTTDATFEWTNSNPAIGLGASGSDNLDFITANVSSPQTGTITVTPSIGSCVGASQTFTIAVTPASATVNSVTDQIACSGQPVAVNFTGTPGATFSWTNSNTAIGLGATGNGNLAFNTASVATPQTATITVSPKIGSCLGPPANFTITVNPIPLAGIAGNQSICSGSGTTITAGGGSSFLWNTSDTTATITVSPTISTTYSVTVSNAGGCSDDTSVMIIVHSPDSVTVQQSSCDPADVGTSVQTLINQFGCDSVVTTVTSLLPGNTTNLTNFTCDPNNTGVFTTTLTNQYGCDSLVVTTVLYDPAAIDTTLLLQKSCDPNDVGTFTQLLTNQFGCDSLVITTVSLLPTNTTNLNATTCDPAGVGTFVQNLSNQFGCDSTVVTTVSLSPTDTTNLTDFTCDPAQTGIFLQMLSNQFGCDSLIFTSVNLAPTDVINLTHFTCNPNDAGVFPQIFTNQFGCDSTVITTVVFDPLAVDTTMLTQMTCDPAQTGVTQTLFNGADGCDSLVIVTTNLSPSNTTNLTSTTCDPSQAGTFTQNLTNQFGCDSTVVTTVALLPTNTTNLTSTTCDPSQAGTFFQNLTNQFGCDSTVVTTVSLLPTNTTNLASTTCDPSQAGTFVQNLTNQFGCDSTVVTAVSLLPTNTTNLASTTCDPSLAGTFVQNLANQFGCDSTVVTTVSLLPSDATNLTSFTCNPNNAGTFVQNLTNQFGCDSVVTTTVLFDPAAADTTILSQITCDPAQAGTTQILLSGTDGCDSLVITVTALSPALQVQTTADLAFNGYAVSCAGSVDGTAQAMVSGGNSPYQYFWSNGEITSIATNLPAGNYSLTVTDQNGCTAVSSVILEEPLPLDLTLKMTPPACGDTAAEATISTNGGVEPYLLTKNGNPVPGNDLTFADGAHFIQLTDANGCLADTTVSLHISQAPQITLPGDTVILTGQPLTISATTNLDVWSLLEWEPLPDPGCADCLTQSWTPLKTQLYTVRITDTSGCVAQAAVHVTVKDGGDVYVPNAFSPDGDGMNDEFLLGAGPSVAALETLSIFDRWGNMVYLWDTPVPVNEWPGWDGSVGSKKAALGVYVYVLKVRLVNGDIIQKEGDVTIVAR